MTGILIFLLGIAAVWHGFGTGGMDGLGFMFLGVILWLFAFASFGMSEPPRTSGRPPPHPPGYKNIKRKKG